MAELEALSQLRRVAAGSPMRENIEQVVTWLRQAGADCVRLEHGGKHTKVAFTWNGQAKAYVLATSTRDFFAHHRAIADLRHMLGLVPTTKQVGERRSRRCRSRAPSPSMPAVTVGQDWKEALRRPTPPTESVRFASSDSAGATGRLPALALAAGSTVPEPAAPFAQNQSRAERGIALGTKEELSQVGTKNNPSEFDAYKRAAPDEPVFTLRASDPDMAELVQEWGLLREKRINAGQYPESDRAKVDAAIALAKTVKAWRKANIQPPSMSAAA